MSTIAYALLTNAREASEPHEGIARAAAAPLNPGVRTYVDAFAALVPAEVLAIHALVISWGTKTSPSGSAGGPGGAATGPGTPNVETVTAIIGDAAGTLKAAFWILALLSLTLYAVPRFFGGKEWDNFDWIRALIAPLAFVGWTMVQRVTVFDAAFPTMNPYSRTFIAVVLGVILGMVTAVLAAKENTKDVPSPATPQSPPSSKPTSSQ